MGERGLRGLNWGHRRATGPLAAAAARFAAETGANIVWEVQPLSGFEHGLGPAVVDRYDLVVFDHPFCGAIARDGLLRPIGGALERMADEDFIGPSLASYRYDGRLWGLPIDGATQVAVYRPDLLGRYGPVPRTWDEVMALGARVRAEGAWLGLACLNPHAFLVLVALCANLGRPWSIDPWAEPVDRRTLRTALNLLRGLLAFTHPDCLRFNAIDLHEAMTSRDDLVYCPLAYGYLTYAEADQRRPLRFADFAGPRAPHHAGSVLGGTGLGVTRSCRDEDLAQQFLGLLASDEAQRDLVAANHGQPARLAAWADREADRRLGGALAATRNTMEDAFVRPRFPGYIAVQDALGEVIQRFCSGEDDPALAESLARTWSDCVGPIR